MPTNRHGPDWAPGDTGTAERLNRMKNVGLAPGSIAATTSSTIPSGWLLCDGRAVSRTTYADLFAAISTTFGRGDGSTTFNLPDFRGRFLRGVPSGGSLNGAGGSDTHALSVAEIPAHTHVLPAHSHSIRDDIRGSSSRGNEETRAGSLSTRSSSDSLKSASPTPESTGEGSAHNNLPSYRQVDWIIKHAPLEDKLFVDWQTGEIVTAARMNAMRDLGGVADGVILASGASSTPDTYSVVTNLRGLFLRGRPQGGTLGVGGGSDTHELTVAELPAHTHDLPGHGHSWTDTRLEASTSGSSRGTAGGPPNIRTGVTGASSKQSGSASPTPESTGEGSAHNNLPSYRQVDWVHRTSDALSTPWNDGQLITAAKLNTMKNALLPAGLIAGWGGHTVPSGWLLCDGRAVSRTTYADLFTAIGTAFGVGDGSTTFTLPDFRGRFLRGRPAGGDLDAAAGSDTHELTVAELPAHTHDLPGHTHGYSDAAGPFRGSSSWGRGTSGTGRASVPSTSGSRTRSGRSSSASPAMGSVGGSGVHNNLPAYRQVDWIISI